jgi:hypothetical protein
MGFKTPEKDLKKTYFLTNQAWAKPTITDEKCRDAEKRVKKILPQDWGQGVERPLRNPTKKLFSN